MHCAFMGIRTASALLTFVALSGCSYPYDVRAVILHGKLAFIVDPNSKIKPDCIRSVHVQTDESARAKPAYGDNSALVANGIYWWKDFALDACPNRFPIFYGQPLIGQPFINQDGSTTAVEPKPLVPGVIYEIGTTSRGSGYGSGRFRIRPDRTVENLPIDTSLKAVNGGSTPKPGDYNWIDAFLPPPSH